MEIFKIEGVVQTVVIRNPKREIERIVIIT